MGEQGAQGAHGAALLPECNVTRMKSLATAMIADSIREEVQTRLREIEDEEGVKVFFACESGSRAWGFPSADSDYDVRFLYAHPRPWYLSIDLERRRDVIERPITDALDISGWDLRKALQLFRKSNPPLLEWLQSPIVYREETTVASRFRDLIPVYYSSRKARYHYLHMAQGNYRGYFKGEEVWIKKYFLRLASAAGDPMDRCWPGHRADGVRDPRRAAGHVTAVAAGHR